jgi:hypothetical protein
VQVGIERPWMPREKKVSISLAMPAPEEGSYPAMVRMFFIQVSVICYSFLLRIFRTADGKYIILFRLIYIKKGVREQAHLDIIVIISIGIRH